VIESGTDGITSDGMALPLTSPINYYISNVAFCTISARRLFLSLFQMFCRKLKTPRKHLMMVLLEYVEQFLTKPVFCIALKNDPGIKNIFFIFVLRWL
jgi:hypothetical protein